MTRTTAQYDPELFERAFEQLPGGGSASPVQDRHQYTVHDNRTPHGQLAPHHTPAQASHALIGAAPAQPQLQRATRQQAEPASVSAQHTPAPETAAPARRAGGIWPAIGWTTAGFIFGIAFWHAVGFWEFIGKVVLHDRHDAQASVSLDHSAQVSVPATVKVTTDTNSAVTAGTRRQTEDTKGMWTTEIRETSRP